MRRSPGNTGPNEDPTGHQIKDGDWGGIESIIGIVADSHDSGLAKPPDPMMMVPIAQVIDGYNAAYANIQPLFWVVRTRGDPHPSIPAITEQLRIASAGFPVGHIRTMDEVMGRSTARQSFNMLLLTTFGVVALMLAAIGIYGLMTYSVEQRYQELGIRMALGADRSNICSLVVWNGMKLALAGIVLGMMEAFGLTRLLANFLFAVKPWDPAVFLTRLFSSPPSLCWPCGCLPRVPPKSIPCQRCARSERPGNAQINPAKMRRHRVDRGDYLFPSYLLQ